MSEPIKGLLSVNSYHYVRGGADAMYFSHAQVFQRAGWENTFFSMKHPDNRPCDTEQYFADRIDFDMSVGLAERMIQAGRIIYSRQAESRLLALLNTLRIDVAHFHCIYHHLSPSVLVAARRRGIPTVMTAHDLKIACPAYKMMNSGGVCERCNGGKVWNVLTHRCIKDSSAASALIAVESAVHKSLRIYDRFTDRIVVPSRFYFDKLVEWGWRPEKLAYVPNFIEPPPAVPPGVGDYFLYFGRIAPEKGLRTFVRAAALAGVPVKIAGTGPDLQSLKQFAQTLAAPVEFVGFKSGEALWSLVDNARAVVLPSEWYENAPVSVIEAFGRGKPLIGARIGGIPELIEEGVTGWSFASGDVEDLAARLTVVAGLADPVLADMRDATRAMVARRFTANAYLDDMLEIYAGLGVT